MPTITKKELIDRIADASDQKRTVVKRVVQTFLDEVVAELAKGNRLEFRDFGVFETKERKARRAQNPRKRQAVWVPQRTTVKFKLGRLLKQKLDALDAERATAERGGPAPQGLPEAAPRAKSKPPGTPPPAGG